MKKIKSRLFSWNFPAEILSERYYRDKETLKSSNMRLSMCQDEPFYLDIWLFLEASHKYLIVSKKEFYPQTIFPPTWHFSGPGLTPHPAGPHSSTGTFSHRVWGVNFWTCFLETEHTSLKAMKRFLIE